MALVRGPRIELANGRWLARSCWEALVAAMDVSIVKCGHAPDDRHLWRPAGCHYLGGRGL